jgi:KDO2-lipid IV(A) lauroyltransferase
MASFLFQILARVPLRVLHALGAAAGWLVWRLSAGYRQRLEGHLTASGLGSSPQVRREAVLEAGKSVTELPAIWGRSAEATLALLRECRGSEHIDAARQQGRGVIFLTPHMGCFEITSLYYAARHPITILYRPPKLRWVQPLIDRGRTRGQVTLAPTDLSGVKALLKALRRNEAIGILPDQVPGQGEGVWAPFFGRPAWTMTLVHRLQQASGAAVLLAFGERLPRGEGYRLWIEPFTFEEGLTPQQGAARMNAAIEATIRRCPAQYLWSYNRYKKPRGVAPPEEAAS